MNCLTCNAPTDAEGRCTDDCQQTKWNEYLTDHELLERILPLLPDATLGEDNDGQWIIYTNCGPRRNAGCDKCGTYDRADGSTFCSSCENEEYERLIRTDTTDCPYCAYNGDTVTTHNPVAHAENGDPDTREEEA